MYDPFGRLLVEKHLDTKGKKKTISTSRYFYIGHQEIGSFTDKGKIETLKIPGLHGDELALSSVAFEIKGKTYAPVHDIAGNVIQLIDPKNRQIVESYRYSAFGEETIYNVNNDSEKVSLVSNPWRFAEKRVNQTGLVHFGLRFYDPTIGRWITQDPAGFIDGPNLYAYLHNNPLNYLDSFGLSTEANSQTKFEEYFYNEVEPHCYCERHRDCKRGGEIWRTTSSRLPKVRYCANFEKMYPQYEPSCVFDLTGLGLLELPPGLGIGFCNGVWNDHEEALQNLEYIAELAGGFNIHGVYNATHGMLPDLRESFVGLNYIATDPVRQLHKMWNSFFEKNYGDSKFLMICHSQGAIHVRNALLDYPPELRERILVVAIAPAAYIYQETCADVIHYRAKPWRDFIPRIDILGAMRSRSSIRDLDSHPNAPLFDHRFTSPTYQKVLKNHINNYITNRGIEI